MISLLSEEVKNLNVFCSTTDDTTENEDEMPTDPNIRAIRGSKAKVDADLWVNAFIDIDFSSMSPGTTFDLN